jgi:hypothetical protein
MLARKLASHYYAGGANLASRAVSSGEDRCGWVKDDSPSQPMLEAALNILPNTVYGLRRRDLFSYYSGVGP